MSNIYHQIGGADTLQALVDHFYDIMDQSPETEKIRKLHPKSLKLSRQKLFLFLSGIFGGPDLYMEKYGHPRLRARHLPFPIGQEEKRQWMFCMKKAIEKMAFKPDIAKQMTAYFETTADHMINRDQGKDPFNIRN